jgi:NAD(P)-dependent dehydrogenase (short-subunit alcohol dehydrogenase family)
VTAEVACVAGGTSGIGRALTERLLEDGTRVVAIGRSAEHAHELERHAEAQRWTGLAVRQADLTDWAACERLAAEVHERHGRLDLLVNGAGMMGSGGIEVETTATWRAVVEANLTAAFNLTKACLGLLASTAGASVVNISSVCSVRPCISLSYSVSKAGMDMFTKALAKELAPKGIRVNGVSPSVVRSNLQLSAGWFPTDRASEEWLDQMRAAHPIGRIGEPRDVVEAIRFLASDQAGWITGATLAVDGGRTVS